MSKYDVRVRIADYEGAISLEVAIRPEIAADTTASMPESVADTAMIDPEIPEIGSEGGAQIALTGAQPTDGSDYAYPEGYCPYSKYYP